MGWYYCIGKFGKFAMEMNRSYKGNAGPENKMAQPLHYSRRNLTSISALFTRHF
jgi:hypothetical protein